MNSARAELSAGPRSLLSARAMRIGAETAARLLDVHSDASTGAEHQFAAKVRIALGAIEGPGALCRHQ